MKIKVFFSWGGELSRQIAKAVHDWLPLAIQSVDCFFSPEDINKGTEWDMSLKNELETSQVGLFFMTKENLGSRWMMYEAGSLPKRGKCSRYLLINSPLITDSYKRNPHQNCS